MKSSLLPTSLDVRRDALMDSMVCMHRHAMIWRRIAAGEAIALLVVVAVAQPEFLVAIGWMALHAIVLGGGVLLLLHRGDAEMGIAPDEYTTLNQKNDHE